MAYSNGSNAMLVNSRKFFDIGENQLPLLSAIALLRFRITIASDKSLGLYWQYR